MTQTFIDTIVVCSITGFTIIATGARRRRHLIVLPHLDTSSCEHSLAIKCPRKPWGAGRVL